MPLSYIFRINPDENSYIRKKYTIEIIIGRREIEHLNVYQNCWYTWYTHILTEIQPAKPRIFWHFREKPRQKHPEKMSRDVKAKNLKLLNVRFYRGFGLVMSKCCQNCCQTATQKPANPIKSRV